MDNPEVAVLTRRDVMTMRYLPRLLAEEMTREEAYARVDEELKQLALVAQPGRASGS